MDIKFPKAGSVRPFELGVRRCNTPNLLQTFKEGLKAEKFGSYIKQLLKLVMRNSCDKLALNWPPSSVKRINYCIFC